ncbi:hypothetical protein [Brevundimonas sp. FT23028]|uniref:hypothetical protein n=1 Tax=Brevundimonas sp. FT23028 TaxID=3393748 RepID=UPI003B58ADF0
MRLVRVGAVVVWGVLWCVSLMLPVIPGYVGGTVLLWGWFAIFSLQLGWLANLTLPAVALLSVLRGVSAPAKVVIAAVHVCLTISAMFWRSVPSEAGPLEVGSFGPGYYLWMGVMLGSAAFLMVTPLMDAKSINRRKLDTSPTGPDPRF